VIAVLGEIHPTVAANFGIGQSVYVFEMDAETLLRYRKKKAAIKPLPKYPASTRDLAILVDADLTTAEIERVIAKKGGSYFRGATLLAVYEGKQVGEGKKSMAFHLHFQSDDKTLTDEEVDAAFAAILQAAEEHGCHACASPTDGFHDAVFGTAEATLRLVQEASNGWLEEGRTVFILGYSPLLFGDIAQLNPPTAFLTACGCNVRIVGRDSLTERPALCWLVSAVGVSAAAWLQREYGVPVVHSLPLGDIGWAGWRAEITAALDLPLEDTGVGQPVKDVRMDKVLIITDPIAAAAISCLLRTYGFFNIHSAAYAWDEETAALYRQAAETDVLVFRTAADLQSAWDVADAVVADPALVPAMGEKYLVPLPSGLLSGRDAAGEGSGVLGANFTSALERFLKQ